MDILLHYQYVVTDLFPHLALYDTDRSYPEVGLSNKIFSFVIIRDKVLVKFDKSVDSVVVPNQHTDLEDEQLQNTITTTTDAGIKPSDTSPPKKSKQPVSESLHKVLFLLIEFYFPENFC